MVDKKFEYLKTGWSVCQCGACVSYDKFEPRVKEFEEKIIFEEKMGDVVLVPEKEGFLQGILQVITGLFIYVFQEM